MHFSWLKINFQRLQKSFEVMFKERSTLSKQMLRINIILGWWITFYELLKKKNSMLKMPCYLLIWWGT